MKRICDAFDDGTLSHDSQDDNFSQLEVEGFKRMDAFVFEQLLRKHLQTVAGVHDSLSFSFGWHIGYNNYGKPAFWFRLEDDTSPWNNCDDAIRGRLETFCCDIGRKLIARCFKVRRHDTLLTACEWRDSKWSDPIPLPQLLSELPDVTNSEVKKMDSVNAEAAALAVRWLKRPKIADSLPALSVQRRFMNCMLRRYLGREGTDLDAMALTAEGELKYLEFKRKFPSKGAQVFGLDEYPHLQTMKTMASLDIGMQHVILVGPRWEKEESPLSWINSKLNAHWAWLMADLDDLAFDDKNLHTDGEDSGHRHGRREQAPILWDRIHLLHSGLALGEEGRNKLAAAISAGVPNKLERIDYRGLRAITVDHARAIRNQ